MIKTSGKKSRRPSNNIRFAVIGVGGMGRNHCNSIINNTPGAVLTAVCDANSAAAEAAARDFNAKPFTSHKKLIASGLCDVAVIATPHPLHPAPAIDCMNAGLHVVCEKPLSERVSTAEAMVKAAARNKVAFAVMFQRRLEPAFKAALKIVNSGRLGRLYRTLMISPEYRTRPYYKSGAWRATWAGEGGGVMMNQSPHIIDLFVQLAGMPCEVFGRTESRMHHIEVEDLAEAMLKYPNGASGYLYCSTNEPPPGQLIELFGDKGKLTIRDGAVTLISYKPAVGEHLRTFKEKWGFPQALPVEVKIPGKNPGHAGIFRNMVRHLLRGEPLVAPGKSGLASLETANAITLSAHTGKWVRLPVDAREYDRFLSKMRRTRK